MTSLDEHKKLCCLEKPHTIQGKLDDVLQVCVCVMEEPRIGELLGEVCKRANTVQDGACM
jgi:hypothetical protein